MRGLFTQLCNTMKEKMEEGIRADLDEMKFIRSAR